jgi:hypothetical protein
MGVMTTAGAMLLGTGVVGIATDMFTCGTPPQAKRVKANTATGTISFSLNIGTLFPYL